MDSLCFGSVPASLTLIAGSIITGASVLANLFGDPAKYNNPVAKTAANIVHWVALNFRVNK